MTRITARNSAGYEAPIGLAADAVVFTVRERTAAVLLVRRDTAPAKGRWALPGRFVGRREDPGDTVIRDLRERTGLSPAYLEQLRTYAEPGRDPRGWLPSIAYLALVPAASVPERPRSGTAWHAVDALPTLAFDHERFVADGLERLRGKLWYANVAVGLLPDEFTMSQARRVYEAIAGVAYDAANFARDLRATGLVRATTRTARAEGAGRPARLYRFVSREPAWALRYARGTVAQPE